MVNSFDILNAKFLHNLLGIFAAKKYAKGSGLFDFLAILITVK